MENNKFNKWIFVVVGIAIAGIVAIVRFVTNKED